MLSGCTTANVSHSSELIDVSKIEQFVIPGKTTVKEAREYLGTPVFVGKSAYGKDFLCFVFRGENGVGEEVGKAVVEFLTYSLAPDESHFVQKNVFVFYDANNVVQEINYHGYAGITHKKALAIYELLAVRPLKEKELKDNINYSRQYIIDSWKEYVAEEIPVTVDNYALTAGKRIEDVEYDEIKYNYTGIAGIAADSARKLYKQFTIEELNEFTGRKEGDGSKLNMLLGTN